MATGDVILQKTGAFVDERTIDPTGPYSTVDKIVLDTGTTAVPTGRRGFDNAIVERYTDTQKWTLVLTRSVDSTAQSSYVQPGTPDPLPPFFSNNKKYTITITEE